MSPPGADKRFRQKNERNVSPVAEGSRRSGEAPLISTLLLLLLHQEQRWQLRTASLVNSWHFTSGEHQAAIFATRPRPPPAPLPQTHTLSKAAIFIIFSLSFAPGWTSGRVQPHLANGRTAPLRRAARRQTAAAGGGDGNKSAPRRSNYRACSTCTTASAVTAGGGGGRRRRPVKH